MRIESVPVGPLEVNCYLVWKADSKNGLIIDPGDAAEEIAGRVRELDFQVHCILLTHAHVDHISGVGNLADSLGCPVWLHAADLPLYHSPANALLPWLPPARNLPQPLEKPPTDLPGMTFTVIHTPGHSPGGCCFHFKQGNLLFSGDTLFAGSVGRTDLPGGDQAALLDSVKKKLLILPEATRVLPGHGPETTIGAEKRHNPYLA